MRIRRSFHTLIGITCVGVLALAPLTASAAWWSIDTDIKAICENEDGGTWDSGNHGGLSGWCMNPKPGRTYGDMSSATNANGILLARRYAKGLYSQGGCPKTGPDGNGRRFCPNWPDAKR